MLKRIAVLTMAASALAVGVVTGTANAEPAQQACYVRAKDDVNIREGRSTATPIRSSIPKGAIAFSSCGTTKGGSYEACGGRSNVWIQVNYKGVRGWSAARCLTFL